MDKLNWSEKWYTKDLIPLVKKSKKTIKVGKLMLLHILAEILNNIDDDLKLCFTRKCQSIPSTIGPGINRKTEETLQETSSPITYGSK